MLGLLLINKPAGITSFGVVAKIKRLAGEKRVGHTGTLDPMATGVLPVLIGRATVLSNYLLISDKGYTARARLGITTDTLDITGNVTLKQDVSVTNSQLEAVLGGFLGKQMQTPPMYSALKMNGERLYNLARRGQEVEIPARQVEIHDIKLTSGLNDNNEFAFSTTVSKGTYIRSLVRDIGEKLNTGATLLELTRTKTAGFCLEKCVPLNSLTENNINDFILPADRAVEHLKGVYVSEKQAVRFSNGGMLDLDRINIKDRQNGEVFRVYGGDRFLGLGAVDLEKNMLLIKCIV